MDYRESAPPPHLAGLIKARWSLAAGARPGEWIEQQATPDGCVEIIRRTAGRSRWDGDQPDSFVVGLVDRVQPFEVSGDSAFEALRLWPWAWPLVEARAQGQDQPARKAEATAAQAAGAPSTFDLEAIDAYVAREAKRRGFPGLSLAIARGGKTVLARGHGVCSIDGGAPVGPDTAFSVGSVTKQVICGCTLLLAEEGFAEDPGFVRLESDAEFVRMLGELPERQRAVLVLRYYADLDDSAVAKTLGCTVQTVRSQASRALKKLRARLVSTDDDADAPAAASASAPALEGRA